MKKQFTLGAVTGMAALAIAFPAVAQFASAQSSRASSTSAGSAQADVLLRGPKSFTQEDVQAMIERDDAVLANIDEMADTVKTATQAHRTALAAAATITDDTARQEAVQAAHEAMRTSLQAAIEANPELKGVMLFGGPGHHGKHLLMRGGPGHLAEKLGMTADDLKAAIDSGKTVEEIAAEKGVELPKRGKFMMRMDEDARAPSAQ